MFKIVRQTIHGRSYYKAGRWHDTPAEGHSYKSLKTAFKVHTKMISQYPAYQGMVTIERS